VIALGAPDYVNGHLMAWSVIGQNSNSALSPCLFAVTSEFMSKSEN